MKTSEVYREDVIKKGKKKRWKKDSDYLGANLKGIDLQGVSFRGALMIAANLSHADLRKADFIGADLRDGDLCHANLTGAIFLTQSQINAAKGNNYMKIPHFLRKASSLVEINYKCKTLRYYILNVFLRGRSIWQRKNITWFGQAKRQEFLRHGLNAGSRCME